jgi:hypothetical protein
MRVLLIPLTGRSGRGRFTLVDDDDYQWAMTRRWPYRLPEKTKTRPGTTGHAFGVDGYMHRAILARHGFDLDGKIVDHRNGWGLDNRKVNLQTSTNGQNARNRYNIHAYKGGWSLVLGRTRIGTWESKEEALAALEVHGPAHGWVTPAQRARLLQPVLDQLESWVREGLLKPHIKDAPLIEDRYRIP